MYVNFLACIVAALKLPQLFYNTYKLDHVEQASWCQPVAHYGS
jgi:hypothetical protein